jgi:DNA polymerase-3 subunit alpha
VIAMVALFRPGPMEFIPKYIRRMHGQEKVDYRHPALEPIFEETFGYPVYQEQLMQAVMNLAGYSAPEADELRKAVSKKQKDKLLKHRQKFIKGAVKNNIPEQTAGEIFNDWEEFARYGFNKAHAADYGVIAVQTAYLKTHYPVEYMTALLTVNQHDTDKVALYVADCRRMHISVEPPDVNVGGYDFTIEDCTDGSSSIRFGLGAVKNVGFSPVEIILKARAQGSFVDINDFARRVDLRSVGRRALESLIRVGALDGFGTRPALLATLEHILSISASYFRAAELGQMSMFGSHSGINDEIVLPKINAQFSQREILNWERDLIGLYVSDHPLNPVLEDLTQVVTHFSAQLSEAAADERVRVAGLITRIRPHQTKKGKAMGFVTLEDIQGTIELVVFPRTWEQYATTIDFDRIVIVEGKIDAQGADVKILVDKISTELKTIVPMDAPHSWQNSPKTDSFDETGEILSRGDSDLLSSNADEPGDSGRMRQRDDRVNGVVDPPEPEAFHPDWEIYEIVPDGFVVEGDLVPSAKPVAAVINEQLLQSTAEEVKADIALTQPAETNDAVELPEIGQEQSKNKSLHTVEVPAVAEVVDIPTELETGAVIPPVPYILSPLAAAAGEDIHMITVMLRPGADKLRDNLRIRQVYGILISYPGNDRFAMQIFEQGRGYRVEFPNFTTGNCAELISRLHAIVGADNVRIEPLKFQ